jgi:hypothetical protein
MPLFGQREHLRRLQLFGVPGLAEVATRQGWQPGGGLPLDGLFEADMQGIAASMYASPGGLPGDDDTDPVSFSDVYRGRLDGRGVIIANAWVAVPSRDGLPGTEGLSVCAVELSSVTGVLSVQPRAYPVVLSLPEIATGHPAFDARFVVQAAAEAPRASLFDRVPARPAAADDGLARQLLTEQVRRLMLTRDDWVFRARRYLLCCVGREPFRGPAEIGDRIAEALAIAAAIPAVPAVPAVPAAPARPAPAAPPAAAPLAGVPVAAVPLPGAPVAAASPARLVAAGPAGWADDGGPADATLIMPAPAGRVLAAPADRTAADLAAALGTLASIDEAMRMLASLTPAEHATLAGLDTPLAALAGAQTAQEAAARYRALDPRRKLQLAAVLMRARDARARARR